MQNQNINLEKHPLKAMILCLLAYFFVALIGVFEKPISTEINISIILFFQSFICLLLILPECLRNSRQLLPLEQPLTYAIRILSGFGCYALLFYLIRFMPISEAYLYQYAGSLWIPFIMALWLNVRMRKKLWLGIIVGFIGITIMLKPGTEMFGFISILGILCGILQGVSMVAIRKLTVTEPLKRILFYYFLSSTFVTGCMLFHHWVPLSLKDFLFLIGVGLSTYIAQKLIALALHYAHASTLAPISYLSILFAGIFGWLVWHEIPSKTNLIGMSLVIVGCLLTILFNRSGKIAVITSPVTPLVATPLEDPQLTKADSV